MSQQNAAGYTSGWHNGGGITSDTRDRIRQSPTQSGFRDVTVTPEAFVIHALAPDGSPVVMLLRPDVVTGVIAQTGSSTGYLKNSASNSNSWNNGSAWIPAFCGSDAPSQMMKTRTRQWPN